MESTTGAVSGNSQNTPTANVPRTRSTFKLEYHMFDTHRFGEYHPHYVEEGVKEDILPIRSSHNILSYTLKSPLMQNITLKKDYFSVPMEAILPNNWEKFFDNPVRGDDVNTDVGPTVEEFWKKNGTMASALLSALNSLLADANTTDVLALTATLRFLIILEYWYSNGNLLASLGCHGAPYIRVQETVNTIQYERSFDDLFDAVITAITGAAGAGGGFALTVDGYNYTVRYRTGIINTITFRHALSLMRDNPLFTIGGVLTGQPVKSAVANLLTSWAITPLQAKVPCNLSRLWAYQIVCAHYYSNDHIDFVYSADLFRQLIGNYIYFTNSSLSQFYFTRNGYRYQYDWLSAKFYNLMINQASGASTILTTTSTTGLNAMFLAYMSALFAYRRSLRYLDYFTGSRAQPLAVGSTGVAVVSNTVDVVDVTRNIQRQRFLNAVNRVRHNFEGYLQGIFGGDAPAPDYHNPFFLASTQDTIFGQQTENTGAAQMSDSIAITTNLRSNGSRYMLEVHCDRPCVIIGISHYDLPRVYSKSTEREFLQVDRFDMFNPFMQFIGDQPLYLQELGINPNYSDLTNMANFAYSLRHMEYKQRFNQAAGAFVNNLPGFAFLANDVRGTQTTINPDWIRSVPDEFDFFFVSLNGWSNGSYFHFIVDNFNDCTGSRPMAYAPSIL